MAESKTLEGITWLASRPAVLPFLVEATAHHWGTLVKFYGSEADLIGAGIATAEMFQIGKSGQRLRRFDFGGDDYTVKRCRGGWDITMRLRDSTYDGLPTDEYPKPCKWWRDNCAEAEAATSAIIGRFAKSG
jgi:hypothetical protein